MPCRYLHDYHLVSWRRGDDGAGRQVVVSAAEGNCRLVGVLANLPCNLHCAASPNADDIQGFTLVLLR